MKDKDIYRFLETVYKAVLCIIAIVAIYAIATGHSWHWITLGACLLVLLGYAIEDKKEDGEEEKTEEGYDKTNDHHPYPMEMRGGRK